jgi:accessory gene regulator B
MIVWLSNCLVRVLFNNKMIEADEIEIYQYGYEIIISTIITFLIVLVSGVVLNCPSAALLYFLIFAMMRQICGGYHAKHYWSCNL